MNIAICDDEEIIVELFEKLLVSILVQQEQSFNIFCFTSGEDLLNSVDTMELVFLDIEMPGIDGIEVGKVICNKNPRCKIVMATSRVERFKESFKINAFRFVTKPFEKAEIEEVIDAFGKLKTGKRRIKVYLDRNEYEIEEKQIKYILAFNSYSKFVVNNKIFRKEISLKEVESMIDNQIFFRINKQYLINLFWITKYQNGIIQIGDESFKVSRRRKKEFEQSYTQFLFCYGE